LRWTTLFFASNLLVFYFVGQAGARIGVVYYIWVGILSVFTVAQLWAFATDLFSQEQGKDYFRYSELERRLERSQGLGFLTTDPSGRTPDAWR
jgi:hypothetical protein